MPAPTRNYTRPSLGIMGRDPDFDDEDDNYDIPPRPEPMPEHLFVPLMEEGLMLEKPKSLYHGVAKWAYKDAIHTFRGFKLVRYLLSRWREYEHYFDVIHEILPITLNAFIKKHRDDRDTSRTFQAILDVNSDDMAYIANRFGSANALMIDQHTQYRAYEKMAQDERWTRANKKLHPNQRKSDEEYDHIEKVLGTYEGMPPLEDDKDEEEHQRVLEHIRRMGVS